MKKLTESYINVSLNAKKEMKDAEERWRKLKDKACKIVNETVETSEEYIAKAHVLAEKLKETYKRTAKRLSE